MASQMNHGAREKSDEDDEVVCATQDPQGPYPAPHLQHCSPAVAPGSLAKVSLGQRLMVGSDAAGAVVAVGSNTLLGRPPGHQ